jgi:hypothetical protein
MMRQYHIASVIDNQMDVFGGGDGKYWLNDLLVLDLVNLAWSGPIKTNGLVCRSPSAFRNKIRKEDIHIWW